MFAFVEFLLALLGVGVLLVTFWPAARIAPALRSRAGLVVDAIRKFLVEQWKPR